MTSTNNNDCMQLYGVTHSPWVQGIYSAALFHKIPVELTSYTISMRWLLKHGPIFPVLIHREYVIQDSFEMYKHLENEGYSVGIFDQSSEDIKQTQKFLERLFLRYAFGRCYPTKQWRFIVGWSAMTESNHSLRNQFLRSYLCLYFLIMIHMGILIAVVRREPIIALDKLNSLLDKWEDRLCTNQWLTGDTIGYIDFALFGHLQCMTSGLTDELIPILQEKKELLRWNQQMIEAIPTHPSIFSKRLSNEERPLDNSDQTNWYFWLGLICWTLFFPVTICLLTWNMLCRNINPSRTGANL